jgi:16S rRNA (cytosine1402-N4)-methyltransferase
MKETNRFTKHVPVLLDEAVAALAPALQGKALAVDATLGGGGHTRALLPLLGPEGRLLAIDRDPGALSRFEATLTPEEAARITLVHANYSDILEVVEPGSASGILADLGFSSDQIEDPARGLSFQESGPLDMRLDPEEEETAATLLARLSGGELARIISEYGDEPKAKRIAEAIITAERKGEIKDTRNLADLIERVAPRAGQRLHPATKTFQALRIAVNREYEHLERFLEAALAALAPGGRLAIITFHSGEDRRVKEAFREAAKGCICPKEAPVCHCGQTPSARLITRKPITPSESEISSNARARSAKLRVLEKI